MTDAAVNVGVAGRVTEWSETLITIELDVHRLRLVQFRSCQGVAWGMGMLLCLACTESSIHLTRRILDGINLGCNILVSAACEKFQIEVCC